MTIRGNNMEMDFDFNKYQTFDDLKNININTKLECVDYIRHKCFNGIGDLSAFIVSPWELMGDYIIGRHNIIEPLIINNIKSIVSQYEKFYFNVITKIVNNINTDLYKKCTIFLYNNKIYSLTDILAVKTFRELKKYINFNIKDTFKKEKLKIVSIFEKRQKSLKAEIKADKLLGYDDEEAT